MLPKNLEKGKSITLESKKQIDHLDKVDFDENWEYYLNTVNASATRNDLKIHKDPFKDLISKPNL